MLFEDATQHTVTGSPDTGLNEGRGRAFSGAADRCGPDDGQDEPVSRESGGHAHGHTHVVAGAGRARLVIALGLALVALVVELVGTALTGSLALLADAGHVLTDAVGLTLALVAATVAARPAGGRTTFGWRRAEVLAATANGALLLGVVLFVVVEAVRRLGDPSEITAGPLLVAALVGLVANAVSLVVLSSGGGASTINLRGARLEVLGDLLGSVAVVVAAIVIATTGWVYADPVASLVIAAMIAPRAWWLLRDALDVLLETVPRSIDLEEVRAHVRSVAGVVDVHDVHAWSITEGLPVLTAHVVVEDGVLARAGSPAVLDALQGCLAEHFDVEHSTLQIEPRSHREHERDVHA